MALESLYKISYDNLQQFVADINRNFAIIQNSPLYKGIPGDEGKPGNKGLTGERGSHFYFVKLEKFLNQYPNEITNGSLIDINWINTKLQSIIDSKKLFEALGVLDGKFVNNDIIVLTSSEMIEYDMLSNTFVKTGISFYQQGSLVTSIEKRIEHYVDLYIKNNSIINSLRNIWVDYSTFATPYAETANTYITNKEVNSAIYNISLNGNDVSGLAVNTHKYIGYNSNMVESEKAVSTVFGSIDDYKTLLNNTISVIKQFGYNATFAPNKNNIPSIVLLQDTTNNGIMFGYKGYKDGSNFNYNRKGLAGFASIFKDYEAESNIHIKSDQGDNPEYFSELLINRIRLYYAKRVEFGDDLIIQKDLQVDANINSRWIRTAEFIKTKYSNNANDNKNVIEVGKLNHLAESKFDEKYIAKDCIYRNISDYIELPNFSEPDKTIVLTVEPTNNRLSKLYSIEPNYLKSKITVNNTEVDWLPLKNIETDIEANNKDKRIITSEHLHQLITTLNKIQRYIDDNYYRIDEWSKTTRDNNKHNVIGKLNVVNLGVKENCIFGVGDTEYFNSNVINKKLIVGFNGDNSLLQLDSSNIVLTMYNGKLVNDYVSNNIVTTNEHGDVIKQYGVFNLFEYKLTAESDSDVDIEYDLFTYLTLKKSDGDFITGWNDWIEKVGRNVIPTIAHLGLLANVIKDKFDKSNSETWHKQDYTKYADSLTGEDFSSIIEEGNIPNIFVKKLLGGRTLNIINGDNQLIAGVDLSKFKTKTLILDVSQNINVPTFTQEYFVSVDNDKNLVTINRKHNNQNNVPLGLDTYAPPITGDEFNQILTLKDFRWLNERINNVRNKIIEDYYKKSEYAPISKLPDNSTVFHPVIPSLYLSNELRVFGTTVLGETDNPGLTYDGVKLQLGRPKDYHTSISSIEFLTDIIFFTKPSFYGKVLVTSKEAGIQGLIRTDIELCEDTSDSENNDNKVPIDTVNEDNLTSPLNYKTKDEHKIITGKQWKWLLDFIDNVKRRFFNTFNKKETIDYVYDHMPVGSIIMWTKASYDILCQSLLKQGVKQSELDSYFNEFGVPKGWIICDGREIPNISEAKSALRIKTPNLVDKFIRGVGSTFDAIGVAGNDTVLINRENLPNLSHNHNCDDIINEHDHSVSAEDNKSKYFKGQVWSNKNLTTEETSKGNYSVNNRYEYNLITNQFDLSKFEIPMVYKYAGANTNIFTKIDFKHEKDGDKYNWRRYDFDLTRSDETVISSNLTTIFKNYSSKLNIAPAKVLISHNIDKFNPGTGADSDIEQQQPITAIPQYYKVVYIMKYDTRYESTIERKLNNIAIPWVFAQQDKRYVLV